MSNVVEVEIKISQLLSDLRSGLNWYAKDGGTSIQEKYGMEDEDVDAIKQHPAFQVPVRVFRIVDDVTKKEELSSVAPVETVAESPIGKAVPEEEEAATVDSSLEFMDL